MIPSLLHGLFFVNNWRCYSLINITFLFLWASPSYSYTIQIQFINFTRPLSWALEKLIIAQLLKEIPAFYRIWMFITAFKTARNWSLSWTRLIKFAASHRMLLRSILILPSHLMLGFPSDSFRQIFLTIVTFVFSYQNFACASTSHECYMLCPFHVPWLGDSSNNKMSSTTNYKALRYAVFSNLLLFQPSLVQIFSSAPRSQLSPSLCSYLSTRNRASHHTKLWAKLRGFCILTIAYLGRGFWTVW
jgi:hypothetical protein